MDSEPRQSPIRRFGDYIERWFLPSSFFHTLVLLIVAFTAVFAIAEIAARESVLSMLTGQIVTLKSEFVEQNRNGSPSVISPTPTESRTPATSPDSSLDQTTEQRWELLSEIRSLERFKRSLQTLIAIGSDNPRFSLRGIRNEFTHGFLSERGAAPQANAISTFILESSAVLLLLSAQQKVIR